MLYILSYLNSHVNFVFIGAPMKNIMIFVVPQKVIHIDSYFSSVLLDRL